MIKIKFKNDQYKKARGGYSRLLAIRCAKCKQHICYYQKDGPGILKRMYLDRILKSKQYSDLQNQPLKIIAQFICPACGEELGIAYVYKKENRLAYRLFVGGIKKRPVSLSKPLKI